MILIALFVWVLPLAEAFASNGFGFAPQMYKSGYNYGNGIYFAPYRFKVYTEPNESSTLLGEFRWGHQTQSNQIDIERPNGDHLTVAADRVFFCFYPELDVAMLAVTGDDDNGWLEIVYDQAGRKTGWVKQADAKALVSKNGEALPTHFGVYQTWLDFMKLNAKASGVFWLSGVNEYQRSIRFKDEDTAKLIPVTIIRDLKVRHVRGNWLLVEVLDFERNTPIGWVRWRDDDGNLMVFPNISGKHLPIVTTAN
jgi:hypothetical protein